MDEVSLPQVDEVKADTTELSERRPWKRPQLERLRVEDTAAAANCGADGGFFS